MMSRIIRNIWRTHMQISNLLKFLKMKFWLLQEIYPRNISLKKSSTCWLYYREYVNMEVMKDYVLHFYLDPIEVNSRISQVKFDSSTLFLLIITFIYSGIELSGKVVWGGVWIYFTPHDCCIISLTLNHFFVWK